MAEYIAREDVRNAVKSKTMTKYDWSEEIDFEDFEKVLDDIPAADVVLVVHGLWEPILEGVWNLPTPVCVGWRCSVCGRGEQHKEPYCNCGAKMDL